MNIKKYLPMIFILLFSLSLGLFVSYYLPISNQPWQGMFLGLVNIVLIFFIAKKLTTYKVGLITSFIYAASFWPTYLEISGNIYLILLTAILSLYLFSQFFKIDKWIFLVIFILVILGFLYKFHQITIFSNVGLINTVNEFRGETQKTIFSSFGKIIENRYLYLSEHVLFNITGQFTPATYFTNQVSLLGFSFTPPIFLGFIIPFLIGLGLFVKLVKKNLPLNLTAGIFLLLPSIVSRNSPDLSRLIIIAPIIFFIISLGLYELILQYKRRPVMKSLLLITILFVVLQFLTTLSDIAAREPIRLQKYQEQH